MAMTRVSMMKPWQAYGVGAVVYLQPNVARLLLGRGVCCEMGTEIEPDEEPVKPKRKYKKRK